MRKLLTSLLLICVLSASVSPQKLRRANVSGGASDLLTGLVSYWAMEEAGVTDRQDAVGANTLAASIEMANNTGKIGNAADFAGSTLVKADNATLDFTTAFTWAGWIYQNSLIADQAIVTKWLYQTQGSWGILTSTGGTDIYVPIADSLTDAGSNSGYTTDASFAATTWYHVAVVYDGTLTGNSNRLKIYINGTQKTLTFSGTIAASLQNSAESLYYGGWPGLSRPLAGRVDEAGLWNDAKTSAQVGRLYNVNVGCPHPFTTCP